MLFPSEKDIFRETDGSLSSTFTINLSKNEQKNEKYGHDIISYSGIVDPIESIGEEDITTGETKRNNLEDEDTTAQIFKHAISMALCKKKRMLNGHYSNRQTSMIPVCGLSPSIYSISMYDAEHDVLLRTARKDLQLFEKGEKLKSTAVLDLWLIIYHHLFCDGLWPKAVTQLEGSCNLVKLLGEKRFQSITENSQWLYQIDSLEKKDLFPNPLTDRIDRP